MVDKEVCVYDEEVDCEGSLDCEDCFEERGIPWEER